MAEPDDLAQQPAASASHVAPFTCPICLESCPKADVFVPSGCTHEFCKDCARGVVLNAVRYEQLFTWSLSFVGAVMSARWIRC